MKRVILCWVFILNFGFLFSQSPVLKRINYNNIGDTVLYYNAFQATSITQGASGANVLWDFSALTFSQPADSIFFIPPVGTPFNPFFPPYDGANICYNVVTNPYDPGNNDHNYLFVDNDSLCYIGHWADNGGAEEWENHCMDYIKELIFPFSYPNQFVDSLNCLYNDLSGSGYHYLSGTNTVIADGYGTLIGPDGTTYNNVIRVHSTQDIYDQNVFFGNSQRIREKYTWYSSEHKGPIFSMSIYNNAVGTLNYWVQVNNDVTVDIKMILRGAYNIIDMNTLLSLPLNDPYGLGESVSMIPNDVVDWVKVELRATDYVTNVIATRACFLRKDGVLIDLDGAEGVRFKNLDVSAYHVVVRHRNHLGVMGTEVFTR